MPISTEGIRPRANPYFCAVIGQNRFKKQITITAKNKIIYIILLDLLTNLYNKGNAKYTVKINGIYHVPSFPYFQKYNVDI
jgi:hypothetical protein